jgi:hypothetical protein
MNKALTVLLLLLPGFTLLTGQPGMQQEAEEQKQKDREVYTLSGFRHGVSFFPRVKLSHVQYEAADSLDFKQYHSADVIYTWLRRWAENYPSIVELNEVGLSYEGRPVLQITVTNKESGKDTDKPAAFFEGGRHSGEVSGCESVLWLANYLITKYGKDPDVTRLIDTRTIYLRPINNPDGHELYMNTAQSNRSTVRPFDNDGDSLLDEDAPEDIDGNGIILTMRWKDEKKGNLVSHPLDSTGRIMQSVPAGKGIYLSSSEGIDNDGDGRINEDGIGGLDLHRNYPENWRPLTEETGRGYTQGGAGEYPLSETETRSVVSFLLTHPNISVVNSMDTSVPMHLRAPSTSPSEERMYPEDLKWYRHFDEVGKSITGYERAGDVFNDYGRGNPLFGHGPDFGYWYYGAIWYGDEIWNGGRNKDYNKDGVMDQIDMLIWDNEENDGKGFFEWKPFKHPEYGDIEIGGFDPKFFSQNPPAEHMETWVANQALFNLEMAKALPGLEWENIEVKRIRSYRTDSADYQLNVRFRNTGLLPTALKQAQLVKIVRDDRVIIEIDSVALVDEKPAYKIINAEDTRRRREQLLTTEGLYLENPAYGRPAIKFVPATQGGSVTTASFVFRIYKGAVLNGKARVLSTRGGVLGDREFSIR